MSQPRGPDSWSHLNVVVAEPMRGDREDPRGGGASWPGAWSPARPCGGCWGLGGSWGTGAAAPTWDRAGTRGERDTRAGPSCLTLGHRGAAGEP